MIGLRAQTLLDGNSLFSEFKGALTEQYVMQQLAAIDGLNIYYYTNDRAMTDYRKDDWLLNLPLYAIEEINQIEI